jgi:hypothetical protein
MRPITAIVVFLILAIPTQPVSASLPSFTSPEDCRTELDNSRSLYNDGNKNAALALLNHMREFCEDFPQVEHNLGVLAASNLQYDQAIEHFKLAIQRDRRAQHTLEQMQAVSAYQASVAYSGALQLSSRAKRPVLAMQDSTFLNDNVARLSQAHSKLHNISTIEYELYDWWNSARENNQEAWLSHYAEHYPPPPGAIDTPVQWQDTQRQINFTAQDAVAIVSYQTNGRPQHRQLLLQLQGNRWKIYQELLLP